MGFDFDEAIKSFVNKSRADADPASWITLENGEHVPLDESGNAIGGAGGWAEGKNFSNANAVKRTTSQYKRTEAQNKTLKGLIRKTAGLKNEQYRIIDKEGNVVFEKKGDRHSVASTVGDKREHLSGNISLHNHPEGGTFSPSDLREFGYGATEIVVAGPDGTYSLVNKKVGTKDQYKGWDEMQEAIIAACPEISFSTLQKQAQENLKNEPEKKRINEIATEFVRLRNEGKIEESNQYVRDTKEEYDDLIQKMKIKLQNERRRLEIQPFHDFYKANAEKYGFEYVFTPKGTGSRIDGREFDFKKAVKEFVKKYRLDASPDSWITLENGVHVPLDEAGNAVGGAGGWAKGKNFSDAKRSESRPVEKVTGSFKKLDIADMKKIADSQREWANGLSESERSAIRKYVGQHSLLFNHKLRTGKDLGTNQAAGDEYKALDDALGKSTLPEDIEVYRGVPMAFFNGKQPDELIGETITDKAYGSTTMSRNVADVYAEGVVCTIKCKKGAPGAYVDEVGFNEVSDFGADENNEILLPRDSGYKVVSAEKKNGVWEVRMEYVPNNNDVVGKVDASAISDSMKPKRTDYEDADSRDEWSRKNVKKLMPVYKSGGSDALDSEWYKYRMNQSTKNVREMTKEEADEVVYDHVRQSWYDGWFREANSKYKPRLASVMLADPDMRSAGLTLAYLNYTASVKDPLPFDKFLVTPITLYRGEFRDQKHIKDDVFHAFSFEKRMAEHFAGSHGSVAEIKVRPIDTYGSMRDAGEAEIWVPRELWDKAREDGSDANFGRKVERYVWKKREQHGLRMDEEPKEWITIKGTHIPLDEEGNITGKVAEEIKEHEEQGTVSERAQKKVESSRQLISKMDSLKQELHDCIEKEWRLNSDLGKSRLKERKKQHLSEQGYGEKDGEFLEKEYNDALKKDREFLGDRKEWQLSKEDKAIYDELNGKMMRSSLYLSYWEDCYGPNKLEDMETVQKRIDDNDKKKAEIESEIAKTKQSLKEHIRKEPIDKVRFYSDSEREGVIKSIRNMQKMDIFPEKSRVEVEKSLEDMSDAHLKLLHKTLGNARFFDSEGRTSESGAPSWYREGVGIFLSMEDSRGPATVWHEYGHYLDDNKESGCKGSSMKEYGIDFDYSLSGEMRERKILHDADAARDINSILEKYYPGKYDVGTNDEGTYLMVSKRGGGYITEWMQGELAWDLSHAMNEEFHKFEYEDKEYEDYIKEIGYPKDDESPKFEDYVQVRYTPKLQKRREKEKYEGAREEYYKKLEEFYDRRDAVIKAHPEYWDKTEEHYNRVHEREKMVSPVSDILCAMCHGRGAWIYGGHTRDYYHTHDHDAMEAAANMHQIRSMKWGGSMELLKRLVPSVAEKLNDTYSEWLWRNV